MLELSGSIFLASIEGTAIVVCKGPRLKFIGTVSSYSVGSMHAVLWRKSVCLTQFFPVLQSIRYASMNGMRCYLQLNANKSVISNICTADHCACISVVSL